MITNSVVNKYLQLSVGIHIEHSYIYLFPDIKENLIFLNHFLSIENYLVVFRILSDRILKKIFSPFCFETIRKSIVHMAVKEPTQC